MTLYLSITLLDGPMRFDASMFPKINAKFLLSHPAHFISLGFGAGLSPKAPGTVGTLWAWAFWLLLHKHLTAGEQGILIILATMVGCWSAKITTEHLGIADPGAIVWDEVVAFWAVLWLLMPASFGAQLFAFLLFRFFDIAKPAPVRWADQVFKGFGWRGAWGIYFDDFVAAFCTLFTMAIGVRIF